MSVVGCGGQSVCFDHWDNDPEPNGNDVYYYWAEQVRVPVGNLSWQINCAYN
jgi:hypothetical protein